MTLIEITNLIINSIGVKQDDSSNISLVKSYINEAYLILCNIDKRVAKAYIPIINGIITLPNNSIGVVKSTPDFTYKDRIYGNSIVTDKTGVVEILYYYSREMLVDDEDEFDLNSVLQQAIINYVCSMFCNQKNEIDQAESYHNAYIRNISQFESMDSAIPEYVMEVDY